MANLVHKDLPFLIITSFVSMVHAMLVVLAIVLQSQEPVRPQIKERKLVVQTVQLRPSLQPQSVPLEVPLVAFDPVAPPLKQEEAPIKTAEISLETPPDIQDLPKDLPKEESVKRALQPLNTEEKKETAAIKTEKKEESKVALKEPLPKKAEPKKEEPKKTDVKKAEPKKPEPKKADPKKNVPEKKKSEPPKSQVKKVEAKKEEPKALDKGKKEAPQKKSQDSSKEKQAQMKKAEVDKKAAEEKKRQLAEQQAVRAKQQQLLSQAQATMAKIEKRPSGSNQAVKTANAVTEAPRNVGSLHIDQLAQATNGQPMNKEEMSYRDELSSRLKLLLKLPEYGEVNIKLTLSSNGKVARVVIVSAKSDANRKYIEKVLPGLTFPSFGSQFNRASQFTFSITLCNDI